MSLDIEEDDSLDEAFVQQVAEISNDKQKLADLKVYLDSEKRKVKIALDREGGNAAYAQSRPEVIKLRKQREVLINQGNYVNSIIVKLNKESKALNRASSRCKPSFAQAFMAAAELMLTEEQFNEIESKAGTLLLQEY